MPDIFKFDDAGRSQSKRSRQQNDCTVRALALAVDISYDEAYDILKEAGRKCGAGFHFKDWVTTAQVNNCKFEWISFPATKGERRMNPQKFCNTFPSGKYIARVAKHVFCVIDGVVHDTFESAEDRCIYGCWKVNHDR